MLCCGRCRRQPHSVDARASHNQRPRSNSSVIEIAVKADVRRIVRPRYRRGCDCPSSPPQAIAPPPARLFPGTPHGISVWARILYERFACFRPLRQVAAWMTDQGLAIAPGTMADSMRRFLPLFAPLAVSLVFRLRALLPREVSTKSRNHESPEITLAHLRYLACCFPV